MIVKKNISGIVDNLIRKYNGGSTAFDLTCYSKLAIIEVCGWCEESMDLIIDKYMAGKLKTIPYRDMFASLKYKNYGFDYKDDFRKMLCNIMGLHNVEELEKQINMIDINHIPMLTATIDILKQQRNNAAHTSIGTIATYQAPTVTKSQLDTIVPILKLFYQQIGKLK